jgi:hypothetical protein
VQDEQIELIDSQLARALVERVQGLFVAVVADPDLGLDEDFRAVDARAAAAVSSGGVWNTPKPSAGIRTPLLSVRTAMKSR